MENEIGSTMQIAGQTATISMRGAEVLLEMGGKVLIFLGTGAQAMANKFINAMNKKGGDKALFTKAIYGEGEGAVVFSLPEMDETQLEKFDSMARTLHMPYQMISGQNELPIIVVNARQAPTLESICKHMNLGLVKEDVTMTLEEADLNKDGTVSKEEAEQVIEQALGDQAVKNPSKEAEGTEPSPTVSESNSKTEIVEKKTLEPELEDHSTVGKFFAKKEAEKGKKKESILDRANRIQSELKEAAGKEVAATAKNPISIGKER